MRLLLTDIRRRQSSPSGNPRYWLHFGDIILSTPPDSMIGYEVTQGWVGKTFEVTMVRGSTSQVQAVREVEQ